MPILFSLTVPIAQAANIVIAKQVTTVLKVNARDFTFSFYFVMGSIFFIYSMTSFYFNSNSFESKYFYTGALGSTFQILGVLMINLAIGTGKAAGPCMALVSCQMVVLTAASSLINGLVPNFMQWLGLIFGISGALILVIPD